MPERLRPTFELLEKAVTEVYEGRLPPQRASALASLAGAMVKIIKAGENGIFSLPTQLDFPGIEKWYEMIRSYRRVKPRLRDDPEAETEAEPEEEDLPAELDKFEAEYGIIQLPKESM